jgi:hypothetical protein
MTRRRFGPPSSPCVAECRICGARLVWLPFTACCGRASACYAEGGKRHPGCHPGQGEGYCGKRDGPVGTERVRVALWAAGAEGGDGPEVSGWTVKGDRVTGRRLPDGAAELRAETSLLLRHQCDPEAVLQRRLAAANLAAEDDQAVARAWAEVRGGGQDRASGAEE